METVYKDGVGYTTAEEADNLEEFEFDTGEKFIRWHPWGDERAGGDVWVVHVRSWKYTVSWIRDRDDIPTLDEHRRYTLLSQETLKEYEVSEAELKRGEWRLLSEVQEN